MSTAPKLTKKQKKALAFRERKGKAKTFDELDNDVPIEENQDLAEVEMGEDAAPVEAAAGRGAGAAKGGTQDEDALGSGHKAKTKKRKRQEVEGADEDVEGDVYQEQNRASATKPKAKKKRKDEDDAGVDAEGGGEAETHKGENKMNQRFILFVGNLKYTTTKEAVEKHFSKCDPPPSVRLMTPKLSAQTTAKSKGFAFVEFTHRNALQQGLKLHQSELEGRNINVELTAGGGGKSEHRLEKVKRRNKDLHEQRKKQLVKRIPSKKANDEEGEEDVQIYRPQRYSATSGIDQVPLKKRTWSIPENDEQTVGKKRGSKKGKKRPPKPLGTGVNAIPVG